jgi:hypothetical protein
MNLKKLLPLYAIATCALGYATPGIPHLERLERSTNPNAQYLLQQLATNTGWTGYLQTPVTFSSTGRIETISFKLDLTRTENAQGILQKTLTEEMPNSIAQEEYDVIRAQENGLFQFFIGPNLTIYLGAQTVEGNLYALYSVNRIPNGANRTLEASLAYSLTPAGGWQTAPATLPTETIFLSPKENGAMAPRRRTQPRVGNPANNQGQTPPAARRLF